MVSAGKPLFGEKSLQTKKRARGVLDQFGEERGSGALTRPATRGGQREQGLVLAVGQSM